MNKIKIILIIAFTIFITGCSGATPRVGAGMGVGIGFSGKKPVVRPYIHGGIGAGIFKFF